MIGYYKIFVVLFMVSNISHAASLPEKLPLLDDNQTIEVNFTLKDKTYHFNGRVDANRYIFNEDGSKTINIATLDWPPYVGRSLCNLGWSIQVAVAVLTAKDYQVQVNFYPWVRAVMMVESGQMEVLFPEYFIEDSAPSDIFPFKKRRELLVQSNEMIGGNISFIKRKGDDFVYNNNLMSIKGKAIGVVRGYQNTPEFDAIMDEGLISVVSAIDELQLLKLLIAKRVDLIIGDPSVFNYVISHANLTDKEKLAMSEGLEEVSPAIKYNHLYFAVSTKYADWQQLLEDINLSLIDFESSGELNKIYQRGSECH